MLKPWKFGGCSKITPTLTAGTLVRSHNELADSLAKKGRLLGVTYIGHTFPTFSINPGS